MTAVERLQAAIEKLEALRKASTPGPWHVNIHHNAMHSAEFRARGPWNGFMLVAAHTNDADPDLIVTLHRTIDAQMAFLSAASIAADDGDRHFPYESAFALADAILGDQS